MEQFCQKHRLRADDNHLLAVSGVLEDMASDEACSPWISLTHPLDVHTKATDTLEEFWNVLTFSICLDSFTHSFNPCSYTFCIFSSIKKNKKKTQAKTKTVIYCYSYGCLLVFLGIFVKTLC